MLDPGEIGPQPVAKPTDEVTDSAKSTPPSSIEKPPSAAGAAPRIPSEASEEKPAPAGAAPNPMAIPAESKAAEVLEPKIADDGTKVLELKPPIVVRDFAVLLGLKPFKLINELMEMGIFGSMNQVLDESVAQLIAEKHGFQLEIRHRGEKIDPAEAKKQKKEAQKKV
ncbi:MAG: translation initiation factor IF-2 N-terminal domain-containing protein, partial [Opitutae bacterium]